MANVKLRSSGRSYKVDRPKRGRPFGLRQNAAPASPHSSAIALTIPFVVRLAVIRILQNSATTWGYFRGSLPQRVRDQARLSDQLRCLGSRNFLARLRLDLIDERAHLNDR